MSHKRPLGAAAPEEQEAPQSPRKRLRRTVLVAVCSARICAPGRRRARAAANLFLLLMTLVARLTSVERLLLGLPNLLQGFQRSVMGSIEDMIRSVLPNLLQGLLAEQFETIQRSVLGSRADIQTVLRTEIQERQAASLPIGVFEPLREIPEGPPESGVSSGVVKLQFVGADRPKNPLYTGSPVQWQNGENAKIALFRDDRQITCGDLSKLQIEILPVYADFFTERGEEYFTKEEFNKQIYMYKGKESVLATINLKNGEACVGSFFFKESSYNTNLRLAARVKRQDPANRVQEAITDHFVVKDRRSEFNEKSYRPSKGDAVHRLKKISQKGKYCTALAGKNITTVKHLMRHYHEDKFGLEKLTGMRKGDWSTMIKHATTCDPGDEIYSYSVPKENCELLFNDFYDLVGIKINGSYIPLRDIDQFQQLKVNNWKMSAYKQFEERENSGGLVPDYLMTNGHPLRALPLNNEAGPSEQARTTWQYPTDIAAQHEFREQHPFQQQNGISLAEVLSNTEAGPSKQAPLFSEHTAHQDLRRQGPMPQNGTHYCHVTKGNILNGKESLSVELTNPSYPLVQDYDLVTGALVTAQRDLYLSSSTTDVPGTSFPVADGVSLQASSLNNVRTDDLSWSPYLEEMFVPEAFLADQGFIPATNAELPSSNNQFGDYEHGGGNQ